MRNLSRRSRRAVATVALTATFAAAAVVPGSAAETVHLYFRAHAGPIRMLGATGNEVAMESITLDFAAAGLVPDSAYRVVASKRTCGRAHVSGATVFVQRLPKPGSDRAVAWLDESSPILAALDTTRSLRLFTKHSGGTQVACAKAIPMIITEEEDGRELVLGVVAGPIRGVAAFLVGPSGATLSSILVGLPAGSTSRVVAVDETCDAAISSGDVVARRSVTANPKGVVESIDFPSYVALGRENSIECLVLTKGATGLVPRATTPAFVYHTITWD